MDEKQVTALVEQIVRGAKGHSGCCGKHKMTLQKLFEIWLETVRQHVKETTFDFYKHMTKHFKYLYEMKIADITPQLLENYYYKLMEGNSEKQAISASTIKHANTVIKIALEFAVKNDLL